MTTELNIPKQFEYKAAEQRIYSLWQESGVFNGDVDRSKKPFCVVMPPPNVTGILHMGHVLDNVPQDVMVRWHRMRGFAAVWVPGTDHAGIATQNVVKRRLAKEGIEIRALGREAFIERVWEWKEQSGNTILEQLKRLGCSCDWRRQRFTMDEQLTRAVLEAFVTYYKKGLIYKGKRIINWCTVCETALANDEVQHEEKDSHLWHIRYPILSDDGSASGEHIIVATTRPETMLGDTAVAVSPSDERYRHLRGKKVLLPLQNRPIPVVFDEYVDPAFGTGVVKITPAHDPNDFHVAQRHSLPMETVIGENGKMTRDAGAAYEGLDRFHARKQVVADLEAAGLLEQIEKYKHAVGHCYRCESVIEPLLSDQWFVRMQPLAEKAKQAVLDGRIKIVPESEKNDYFHWMDTIQDWCISRQLWWGHRIPVYYCGACGHVEAKVTAPAACEKCGAASITQDSDVLDTWFSSQLWPFSTLGWPDNTEELKFWYPNNWLMSGRDILFFWDARMIMAGLELIGDVPFNVLALHGIVRDQKGRKLSKSLGNSPDPIGLFEEHGTDAVRASIAIHYPMGRQDTNLTADFYRQGKALVTKLWNAVRLLLMNLEQEGYVFDSSQAGKTCIEDRWIISRLRSTIQTHDLRLTENDYMHSIQAVSDFFWNEFCDWYLEIIKPRMREGGQGKQEALAVAFHVARTLLKLFHLYIPFITEELWQTLRQFKVEDKAAHDEKVLALSSWPNAEAYPEEASIDREMDIMMSIVRSLREVRANLNIPPKQELELQLHFFDTQDKGGLAEYQPIVERLGFVSAVSMQDTPDVLAGFVPVKFNGGVGSAKLPENVDAKEIAGRLTKKAEKLETALTQLEARLADENFVKNAPAQLVAESTQLAGDYRESIRTLREFLASLP